MINDIMNGLRPVVQEPIDARVYKLSESDLADLGTSDNLAFSYLKRQVFQCVEEGTTFVWREPRVTVIEDEDVLETGLLPEHFIYPDNWIKYGIDYSLKNYNFFPLVFIEEENEKNYTISNIGEGISVYKESNTEGNITTFSLRKFNSVGFSISLSLDGNSINIEPTDSGILQYIVNSDYVGDEELGTIGKPFKNYQNALDAYVGAGISNQAPINLGTIIRIQKDTNIFVGSIAYTGLQTIVQSGASLKSLPSTGVYFCDLDSDASLPANPEYSMIPFANNQPVDITFTVEDGGNLEIQKEGFKNRGTNLNSNMGLGKVLRINGEITKLSEVSTVSPSIQRIFSLNADNQAGFFNDGNVANVIFSGATSVPNSQIAYIGLNTKLYINDSIFQFGTESVAFNSNTIPFQLNGGTIITINTNYTNFYNNSPTYSLINYFSLKTQSTIPSILNATNCQLGGAGTDYFIANLDVGITSGNQVILDKCSSQSVVADAFMKSFMASGLWEVRLTDCNIFDWKVDDTKIALIPNSTNTLSLQVVETLTVFGSRASAISAGLFKGCKFINSNGLPIGTPDPSWFLDIIV